MGGEVRSDEPRLSRHQAAPGGEMTKVGAVGPAGALGDIDLDQCGDLVGDRSGIAMVQATARNGTRRWAIGPLAEPTKVHPTSCLARLQGVFWVVISGDYNEL